MISVSKDLIKLAKSILSDEYTGPKKIHSDFKKMDADVNAAKNILHRGVYSPSAATGALL